MAAKLSPAELEARRTADAREAVGWERWLPLAADRLIERGWDVERACDYCLRAGAVEDAAAAEAAERQENCEMDRRQAAINRIHMERD